MGNRIDLGVVAPGAELQHLVEVGAASQQAAQAPEGAAPQAAAAHALELPIATHLQHAHTRPDVHQQVWVERVLCRTDSNLKMSFWILHCAGALMHLVWSGKTLLQKAHDLEMVEK